jgi:HAD superfamily hydrolase (TIGR01509 family)
MVTALRARRCWIFDLDGTLTVAQHDFAAMKRELGLPADQTLLEAARARPPAERARLLAAIDAWELAHAHQAVVRPGAAALLEALRSRGIPIGVLTRNTLPSALKTLEATGLAGYFAPQSLAVAGRDCAAPKPAPDGLHLVAGRLQRAASEAVMVGDYRFDLEAGRAAGAFAVWLDAERVGTFRDLADLVVHDLHALLDALLPPPASV